MKLESMLLNNKFSLVVSLPSNNTDFAQAALDGGADAIKVHVNVLHAASGNLFGSFTENRPFLEKLIAMCNGKPVGLVIGGADACVTEAEKKILEDIGIDFFSCYSEHLPAYMLKTDKITRMVAIHDTYETVLDAVKNSEIQVVEASIMKTSAYGTPLNFYDLLQYRKIVEKTGKPVLVPTQKAIRPDEVFGLVDAGCKAVMIGANVMDKANPESCLIATREFRKNIDALL